MRRGDFRERIKQVGFERRTTVTLWIKNKPIKTKHRYFSLTASTTKSTLAKSLMSSVVEMRESVAALSS
jgi:hypothetical protein